MWVGGCIDLPDILMGCMGTALDGIEQEADSIYYPKIKTDLDW